MKERNPISPLAGIKESNDASLKMAYGPES